MQKYTITLDEMKTMNFQIGGFSKKKRKRRRLEIASEASAPDLAHFWGLVNLVASPGFEISWLGSEMSEIRWPLFSPFGRAGSECRCSQDQGSTHGIRELLTGSGSWSRDQGAGHGNVEMASSRRKMEHFEGSEILASQVLPQNPKTPWAESVK